MKEKCLQWAFVKHDFGLHLVHIHIMDNNEVCPSYVGVTLRRSPEAVVAAWLSDMPLSMQHKAPQWLSHPTDLQRSIQNLFAVSTPAEFSHEIFANCSQGRFWTIIQRITHPPPVLGPHGHISIPHQLPS